jgi:hypothetical protein
MLLLFRVDACDAKDKQVNTSTFVETLNEYVTTAKGLAHSVPYSMSIWDQQPHCDVPQEISHLLGHTKFYRPVHSSLLRDPILSQLNPFQIVTSFFHEELFKYLHYICAEVS